MAKMIYGHIATGMRAMMGDALIDLGKKYENMVVVDAETAVATNIDGFHAEYPDRFVTVGIAEQTAVSFAFGLSRCGYIPVLPLFSSFIARRALDQIYIQMGYPHANIKILGCYAGISTASNGATHQMMNDINVMRSIPGMVVIDPADPDELYQAMDAVMEYDGPAFVRVIRADLPEYEQRVTPEGYKFQIGKSVVLREGTDISLVGSGMMVPRCMEAAEKLAEKGISAEVVNLSSIKPIDRETLAKTVKKTGRVLVAETCNYYGGVYGAVAEVLGEEYPVPMASVSVGERYGHSATIGPLMKDYNLTTEDILAKAEKLLQR